MSKIGNVLNIFLLIILYFSYLSVVVVFIRK